MTSEKQQTWHNALRQLCDPWMVLTEAMVILCGKLFGRPGN